MDKDEFLKALWSGDFKLLYELCDIVNLAEGENMYYKCSLCNYETKHVTSYDNLEKIDYLIADHLWEKHRSEVVNHTLDYESKKIGSAKNQTKLDDILINQTKDIKSVR